MHHSRLFVMALLVVTLAVAPMAVSAQDTAGQQGINCDSTLISLVLLAQQGFGYQPSFDLTTFNRGQFGTYFDEMGMGGMMDQTGQTGTTTDQSGQAGQTTDMTGVTPLTSGAVAGEDPNCAALRNEVETFVMQQLQSGVRLTPFNAGMGMDGGTGTGGDTGTGTGTGGDTGTGTGTGGDTGTGTGTGGDTGTGTGTGASG